jgi:hypothetical protein
VALSCINYAFKLNALINTELEAEDVSCLEEFASFRKEIFNELVQRASMGKETGGEALVSPQASLGELPHYSLGGGEGEADQGEDWGTHELLIAEADTVLSLADEMYELGFKFEAMLNYHTSCVFYRVMETMIPSKASSIQHSRLMHAANVPYTTPYSLHPTLT